jgi:hypothetical protein
MDERLPAELGAIAPVDDDGGIGGSAVANDRVGVLTA